MIGSVENQEQESGLAALSACDGLVSVLDFYAIETDSSQTESSPINKGY